MSEYISLDKCCEILKTLDNVLILTHKTPDGDTLGSAYGLMGIFKLMGKKARVICSDDIPKKYSYFTEKFPMEEFEIENIISTDVADTGLLGEKLQQYADKVVLAIDHHRTHKDFAQNIYVDADSPATAEIIYTISEKLGVKLDINSANALFTGICTDTGGFKFDSVKPYTHIAAARLMELGAESAKINKILFNTKSKEKLALETKVLNNLKFYFDNTCALAAVFQKDMEESGVSDEDLEGVASIPATIEGVEIGVTLKEKEGGFKISMRSNQYADVSKICKELGGGGHIRAAGCFIAGSYENAVDTIMKTIDEIAGVSLKENSNFKK